MGVSVHFCGNQILGDFKETPSCGDPAAISSLNFCIIFCISTYETTILNHLTVCDFHGGSSNLHLVFWKNKTSGNCISFWNEDHEKFEFKKQCMIVNQSTCTLGMQLCEIEASSIIIQFVYDGMSSLQTKIFLEFNHNQE